MAPTAKTAERPTTQAAPRQAPTGNLPATQDAKAKPPIVQFREYVNQRMLTLEKTLPPHINSTYFVSAIMVALQKKPSLLKCTFASIWNACVEAAKDGLLPDGKEGAIVPYGENADGKRVAELATWMPMIEGYRKKIFETGKVKSWEVQVVREKDEFEYELGDNAFIRHKHFVGITSAGNVVGAYSVAKLMTGETVREVMGAYDIMQIANKSKAGNGPWKDPAFVPEMARKVVARRHYKQLPHSRELSAMIARDDERFGIDFNETDEVVLPRRAQPHRLTSTQAFDAYATSGSTTIDHETGEVLDDGDFQSDGQSQTAETEVNANASTKLNAGTVAKGGASKGADAAASGAATRQASAPTQQDAAASVERHGDEGAASTGTGANEGTSAPASTKGPAPVQTADAGAGTQVETGQSDAEGAAEVGAGEPEVWGEEESTADGADRPWPPGAVPSNEAEYERYLDTVLAGITDGSKVAPWWNSDAEKNLRKACNVVRFKELQDKAIARRKELSEKPVR
jgi:recombination protein RecT